MAALVVQSRFAGLVIEDDIEDQPPQAQKSKKAKPKAAAGASKKPEANAKKANTGNKAPTAGASKKKKGKGNQKPAEQWEQWRQKDEQLVDGHYEDELQQAILLSKLDFEQKKEVYKLFKKEAETQKKDQDKAGNKKQKKKNVMSLDQFNDMVSGEEPKINHVNEKDPTDTPKSPDKDTEFFERVKDETKNELLKDKINDRVRNCKPLSNEIITRVQYAEALEKKDKEIADLHEEITVLKTELFTVKSRNKKLCNILGQGEMKDKAEVLIEVERLRAVQGELTAELAALHTELEKSRSKNGDHRSKDNKKKKGANGEKEK
ncbi:hypothetical protein JYU34_016055 [Plutella xylostella]|uniref:Uncharacterized protein n=2 Tax=Plutella xylostella TaxID=51655 RepID=A0ABQ7Q6Q9_PLUXY|nr:G kinase-anchoring protein 1 [Plutella xylostella]KAG7300435.1 hypothetical protein JYU34_016055 [Plutella xylostella]CAG9130183.1 unnamed protein product [Plutella xylostella]